MEYYADHKPETSYTNNWAKLTDTMTLAGKSLGVIGLGEVGAEVALLAQGLGMKVCYTQRNRNHLLERQMGVEYLPLDELLATCDIVSLHLPLNESTTGFLASDQLKLMRPSSLLVNVSRGAVVDEAALVDALSSGVIAGAAFDTFWQGAVRPQASDARYVERHRDASRGERRGHRRTVPLGVLGTIDEHRARPDRPFTLRGREHAPMVSWSRGLFLAAVLSCQPQPRT